MHIYDTLQAAVGFFFNPPQENNAIQQGPSERTPRHTRQGPYSDSAALSPLPQNLNIGNDKPMADNVINLFQEVGEKQFVAHIKKDFRTSLTSQHSSAEESFKTFQEKLTFISELPNELQYLKPQLFLALAKLIPASPTLEKYQKDIFWNFILRVAAMGTTFPASDPTTRNAQAKILIGIGNLIPYSDCLKFNNVLPLTEKKDMLDFLAALAKDYPQGHWAKLRLTAFGKKIAKDLDVPCIIEISNGKITLRDHRGRSDWLCSEPLPHGNIWGNLQKDHTCLTLPPGKNIQFFSGNARSRRHNSTSLAPRDSASIDLHRNRVIKNATSPRLSSTSRNAPKSSSDANYEGPYRFEVICQDTIARGLRAQGKLAW